MSTTERKRYCDIRAECLQDLVSMADRHIRNIGMTLADAIDCEDATSADKFYTEMIRGQWQDLKDDVLAMIARSEADMT